MLSTRDIPIAQTSESTLQQDILPCRYGSSTRGQKKSVVEMSFVSSRTLFAEGVFTSPKQSVTEQSGVSLAIEPSPILSKYWNSLPCGTLHPQPLSAAQLSKLKPWERPNLLQSKFLACRYSSPKLRLAVVDAGNINNYTFSCGYAHKVEPLWTK